MTDRLQPPFTPKGAQGKVGLYKSRLAMVKGNNQGLTDYLLCYETIFVLP